ncbi:hypothetical protein DBW_1182 [Desulfuromonas sp. DDH964]|uniref:N-acetylmuramoyl-L-alanine amidase-like domain-containing protein n=1 Tax=Desulfuromonas sp. DDH964 TaxID=1823759 RepID=UPI00078B4788|nr:N-acetylmuramoyl-L-alanine amidase-like domain-containing protein [Desulfuromonas sp. DDH964]AMV71556.1 hypothetical protein DBW_1182 [Desulfuromonas sp. DDH964]
MQRIAFSIVILLLFGLGACARQQIAAPRIDYGRWSEPELAQLIAAVRPLPPGARIVALSAALLGTPYASGTLVGGPERPEQLIIDLAGVDCFTFLDQVEALRRAASLDDFPQQLRQVRYRGGVVSYVTRRHFFSDWVADGAGRIADVTAAVGQGRAEVVVKELNRREDGSPWLPGLAVTRRAVSYIPTPRIDREVLAALQEGDYVGIYAPHAGEEVSHTGLVVRTGDQLLLRHASSASGLRRVVDVDLLQYLQGKPGLVVYRAR